MELKTLKLVTVVAEAFVSDRIIREIQRLGATGYTASPASGKGSREVRASEWEVKNVRIETLVNEEVAASVLNLLARYYYDQYAVIAYVQDVGVVRGAKYG